MAAHEESPKRMCKSTSMRSTPSHESHHGIEIEHDMEIPLTVRVIDNDRKKTRSHGSTRSKGSYSSVCSNNVKKLRTKVEIERGSSTRTSPLTPQRDYIPVPQDMSSPRRTIVRNPDMSPGSEHMSLFRTSPLVKPKVPRSPKIHPSPKFKHAYTSKTPVNDPCDSLKSRHLSPPPRQASSACEPQRVVMGSDNTPTNSIKSPPSDISKTGSETPTNINNDIVHRKHRFQPENAAPSSVPSEKPVAPNDIKLQDFTQQNGDNERNPASGTSDDSGSAEKELGSQMTTSFIENNSKPRRPTSLTESYSKMSIASALSKGSVDSSAKDKTSVTSSDDRQQVLPKPDGQSPKSQRLESMKVESRNGSPMKTSKASTPRSVRSLRGEHTDGSSNTKSPARSINTPSDVIELEYDDFIDMDDTYSYFDPIETEKLTWQGVERVNAKTPKEDSSNGNEKINP